MKGILDQPVVETWLGQFDVADRSLAAKLVALIRLVPGNRFRNQMTVLLEERLKAGSTPIALFNETERQKWKGQPHRLFPEKTRKRKGVSTTRACGNVGPALIPRQRYVHEQIGSEGVVSNILTQFSKGRRKVVFLSPGPDTIRDEKIRRFILVTDFIGSGTRVRTYLDSAWRIGSVRSWWSRREGKGMSFEVIAYSGTDVGIDLVENHPCRPTVSVAARCPTVRTVFPPAQATSIRDLCERYGSITSEPLGYGNTGVLLAFDHGMPNNAPPILWQDSKRWNALFPKRVTVAASSPFHSVSNEVQERDRLEATLEASAIGQSIVATNVETIVLSALRRSPRNVEAVSGRIGLDLVDVKSACEQLERWGWIDGCNQLTERGRLMVRRLASDANQKTLPLTDGRPYFPKSLRVPRDV